MFKECLIIGFGNSLLTAGTGVYTLGGSFLRYLMVKRSMQTNMKASAISYFITRILLYPKHCTDINSYFIKDRIQKLLILGCI